jgi:hypothetical protein
MIGASVQDTPGLIGLAYMLYAMQATCWSLSYLFEDHADSVSSGNPILSRSLRLQNKHFIYSIVMIDDMPLLSFHYVQPGVYMGFILGSTEMESDCL